MFRSINPSTSPANTLGVSGPQTPALPPQPGCLFLHSQPGLSLLFNVLLLSRPQSSRELVELMKPQRPTYKRYAGLPAWLPALSNQVRWLCFNSWAASNLPSHGTNELTTNHVTTSHPSDNRVIFLGNLSCLQKSALMLHSMPGERGLAVTLRQGGFGAFFTPS